MGAIMELEFATTELVARNIVGIRGEASPADIGPSMGPLFAELAGYIQSAGQAPAGPPLAIYHAMKKDCVEFECAIPVGGPIAGTDRIRAGELPECIAATVTHSGPYEGLPQTWSALTQWMAEKGLPGAGAPWEVYVTDPTKEPDSSKWRTEVFFPVRGDSQCGPAPARAAGTCDS